jgi:glycosyltransferase involved in cell wall biosynthesis
VKLAFVVQRFGADIAGGSEAHCRDLAHRLSASHDVTVLTSTARDYVSWANAYPAGASRDGRVTVVRFPVRRGRRMTSFADISDEVFDGGAAPARQDQWFRENGPDCPDLLAHLAARGHEYDLVLFWTFRYATTYFGLPLVADRAILLPTAEDDPAVRLEVLEPFLARPAGYLFLTPEEEALIAWRAGRRLRPSAIVGTGIERAQAHSPEPLRGIDIAGDYVLYVGRVDRNKGCRTLLDYFEAYSPSRPELTLVLAGPATMTIPAHPRIRALGYVPDERREALLAGARALVVPSRYESLSIVLLEAWNHAVPAVVNEECAVLDGQVRRANGGLVYRSAAGFAEALDYLVTQPQARDTLGRQGLAYVEREYRWPTVLARVEHVLREVASRRGDAVKKSEGG